MKVVTLVYQVWVVLILTLVLATILQAFDYWEDPVQRKINTHTIVCDVIDSYGRKRCQIYDIRHLNLEDDSVSVEELLKLRDVQLQESNK